MEPTERIAHVYCRLGIGAHPELVASTRDVDEAIARALDLRSPAAAPPTIEPPASRDEATNVMDLIPALLWWVEQMVRSPRLVEERLAWFWHDHFATSLRKVRFGWLLWQQHLTIRGLATGRFDELLSAVTTDPAMLLYLDGARNQAGQVNENHARELMELHTLGRGAYTQADVVDVARALTGWVVLVPPLPDRVHRLFDDPRPWTAVFVPSRHDPGMKTVLGVTDDHDVGSVLALLADHPATGRTIAGALYRDLVGLEPDGPTLDRLATSFRTDLDIRRLVAEIAAHPVFVSDAAIGAKVRTPLEKVVAVVQAFDVPVDERIVGILDRLRFVPFLPPNPAGFPSGPQLLDPGRLAGAFQLLELVPDPPRLGPRELLARLGIHEVSDATLAVLGTTTDPVDRLALALASPEFSLV